MGEGPSDSAPCRSTIDSILPDNSSYQTPPTTYSSLPASSAPIAPPLPAAARRQFVPAQGPIGFDKAEDPTSVPFPPGVTADLSDRSLLAADSGAPADLRLQGDHVGGAGWRLVFRRAGGPDLLQGLGWDEETDADGARATREKDVGWCGWVEAKELERACALFGELPAGF
jgi:hypothetical protein